MSLRGVPLGKAGRRSNLVFYPLSLIPALSLILLAGCSRWGSMDHPVNHKPQSFSFYPPPGSVPIQGNEAPMTRDEADKKLTNPVPSDQASLEEGRKRFEIYCTPCHGPDAKGHGPVSTKFIPPPDLTQELFKGRSDGYLYATIRNGGAIMPAYGERLTPKERWDVVNYLRKLQGR